MKERTQTVVIGCATVFMAFLLVASFTFAKRRPQLTISYLAQTNDIDHFIAFFTISNAGNVCIESCKSGSLEVLGQNEPERVGCETKLSQLQPGCCDIATVYLPRVINKPWRFTIYYTGVGTIRPPRIYFETSDWTH